MPKKIIDEDNILVKCNVTDGLIKKTSESCSKEKLEVSDLMQESEEVARRDLTVEISQRVEEESVTYSELCSSLKNIPQTWSFIHYERFRELCRNVIRETYNLEKENVGGDGVVLKSGVDNNTIENCCNVMLTPLRLLRFLVGFDFNTVNAFSAFSKHIKWRKEFNIDTVVRPFVVTNMVPNNNIEMAPLHNTITRYYPCNLLLRESTGEKKPLKDKYGNIICIERFGLLDEARLLGAIKVDELLLWYSYHMEYRSILLDKLSSESKTLIKATCIMDLYGLSVSHVHSSHIITILRRMIQLASDNYPEGMSYVVFVNAPKFFSIVWNSLKPLLAARTVEKIIVLDEDYKERLFSIVSVSNLPQFLGGLTTEQYSTVPNTGTLLLDCFGLGDDRQTLHIKRMKKEKVTISIIKPNTFVYWTWGVLEGEIGFGAKYVIDDINTRNGDSFRGDNGGQTLDCSSTSLHCITAKQASVECSNLDGDFEENIGLKKPCNNSSIVLVSPQIRSHPQTPQHEITVVSSSKFDSTKAYGGSYFASSPGHLILQWDNSWSLFSGKTIHFVIKTTKSSEEEDARKAKNSDNGNSQKNGAVAGYSCDNAGDSGAGGGASGSGQDCDKISNKSNKFSNVDLYDIENIVSHNVALKAITKKRPSKSHKSMVEKATLANGGESLRKRSNKGTHIAVIKEKSPHIDVHFDKNKSKQDRGLKFKNNENNNARRLKRCSIDVLNDRERRRSIGGFNKKNVNEVRDSADSKCSGLEVERTATCDNLSEKELSSNSDLESHLDTEGNSSNSDCPTNSSYVTANSVTDDSFLGEDIRNSVLIRPDRRSELIGKYSDKSLMNSDFCRYSKNSHCISEEDSVTRTQRNCYYKYLNTNSSSASQEYRHSFTCKKSIESRVDIYGCENFGAEFLSSEFNRQRKGASNYSNLSDSFCYGKCFRYSFECHAQGGGSLAKTNTYIDTGTNTNTNNENTYNGPSSKKLERILSGVRRIKRISDSLLSKTSHSDTKNAADLAGNKYIGQKKNTKHYFFQKIKSKLKIK